MPTIKVRKRRVPPLVGLQEAAEILDTQKQNLIRSTGARLVGLPPPLQDRGIDGFDVVATPLWPRAEIEELAQHRNGKPQARPSRRRAPAKRA